MKDFFSMKRTEALFLVFLLVFSVVAFLPLWRTIEIQGIATFGWLMALLMILSPIIALYIFNQRP